MGVSIYPKTSFWLPLLSVIGSSGSHLCRFSEEPLNCFFIFPDGTYQPTSFRLTSVWSHISSTSTHLLQARTPSSPVLASARDPEHLWIPSPVGLRPSLEAPLRVCASAEGERSSKCWRPCPVILHLHRC